ncbi:MAG TPA: hypothetical protein VJJ98_05915 [Sedimentisphaerales bacterium]|nr:hypothetical protein [Sedimentisphaerales bacterium]
MGVSACAGFDIDLKGGHTGRTSEVKVEDKVRSLVLSGAGVAAISVGGYLVAFAYEAGYITRFGVPIGFITLNLTSVFVAISSLCSILILAFLAINAVCPIVLKTEGPVLRGLVRNSPFLIVLLVMLVIYSGTGEFWGFLFVAGLVFVGEFILPLLTQRGKKTYREKLEAHERMGGDHSNSSSSLIGVLGSTPRGLAGVRAIACFVLILYFSFALGTSRALKQKDFLVLAGKKEMVVVRVYDGQLLCVPFDRATKRLERSLVLLDRSKENGLRLDWEQLGPLAVWDKRSKQEPDRQSSAPDVHSQMREQHSDPNRTDLFPNLCIPLGVGLNC